MTTKFFEKLLQDYPGARMLEYGYLINPIDQKEKLVRILDTKNKNYRVRIENEINEENAIVSRHRMVADYLLVMLKDGQNPKEFHDELKKRFP